MSAGLAKRAGLPAELLLMASLGEYELVFGVPAGAAEEVEREMAEAGQAVVPLGEVREGRGLELRLAGRSVPFEAEPPDPRAMPVDQYIEALAALFASLAGAGA